MRFWLFFLVFGAQGLQATTLKDAFTAARQNMESIKRADMTVEQREEQKNRAKAAVLPTIAGVGNYTRIDPPDMAGVSSAFTLTKQYSMAIRLTQPLIRGGVLGAYQLAKENILLAEFQKNATDINLYQLVINAFYSLKVAQIDIKNLEELSKFSKERVSELRGRVNIGRSRRGELLEAEAQWHNAEAQLQQGMIALEQASKQYEFLTKQTPPPLDGLPDVPKVSGGLADLINKVKARPDIMAVKQQIQVANSQIEVAKGGHYPSLDLIGNYYIDRTGILATSEWDAGIVFTIPFYQGGGVQASVRESVAAKRIAELTSDETERAATRELSILFQNYNQLQAQLESTKKALINSQEAYKLNQKDYRNGLVTNLDVLQSLNIYIQNKRSYDTLFAMAHMTYRNLEASVGVLP